MIEHSMQNYLEQLIPERNPFIMEMEAYAKENNVPIMELIGIEALLQLLRVKQPRTILEIGAAIGYSAIRMAEALPNTTIYTIERDKERYELAISNIGKLGLEDRIHVIFGDALEEYKQLEKTTPFDVLFIDAAKGQYQKFFELYSPLLSQEGIIISDNVLFRGHVAEEHVENKKLRTLANKINRYNQWLVAHPDFLTTILPIGDGIAISIKNKVSR